MNRTKLDTIIEREAHKLIENVKNHAESFVQLYCRRKGVKVDPELLNGLVEVMKAGIDDGFGTQVDLFNKGVDKALTEYVGEEAGPLSSGRGKKKKED